MQHLISGCQRAASTQHYTNDNLIAIEDPLGRVTRYLYDDNQRLTAIILANGSVSSNVYDALGRIIETIAPDGTRIATEYDNIDRAVRTIFRSESAAPGQPNINGNPCTETIYGCCGVHASIDRAGRMTSYDYDPYGRLTRVKDAAANVIAYAYNADGNLTSLTDANGNATTFTYADFDFYGSQQRVLSAITFPNNTTRSFAYQSINPTLVPVGVNAWSDPIQSNQSALFFENGRTAGWQRTISGSGYEMQLLTDFSPWNTNQKPVLAVRNLSSYADPPYMISSRSWSLTNNNNSMCVFWGYSVTVTSENGPSVTYDFDLDGRLSHINPKNFSLNFNLFDDNNLARIEDSAGQSSISFLYDAIGQLLCESNHYVTTPALQSSSLYAYDAVGNRTNLKSHISNYEWHADYAYDNLDRLTNIASSGLSAAYSFADPAGNLTNKTYNNGVYTDYAYDACGRLTGLTNRTQSAILDAYQYGYDPAQMITSITRLAGAAAPATVGFAYDKTYQLTAEFGRYASNFVPFVSFVVSNQFAYDPAGNRILSVGAATAPQYYSHTSDNQLTGIYWNTSKLTLGGILQDCLTAHWVKVKQNTAAIWVPAQLKLRKAHDVAWLATNVPVSGTGTLTFDIQAQITNNYVVTQTVNYQKASTGSGSILYAYDANGNRISKTDEHGRTTSYSYDQDNQLTDIDGYAADSTHFVYSYAYDPFGRRISATEDGVTRYFAYDGLDCIAELDHSGNVVKWYTRGTGLGGGIGDIVAEVSPTTTNYYYYNHRGDVVGLVSKSGIVTARYEFTAFGQPLSSIQHQASSIRSIAFSSKEFDTRSGLSYYGFRYYDAGSGRWMTKDKLMWADHVNCYMFLHNMPADRFDYYGLLTLDPTTCRCMPDGTEMTNEQKKSYILSILAHWHQTQRNLKQYIRKGNKKSQKVRDCLIKLYPKLIVECRTERVKSFMSSSSDSREDFDKVGGLLSVIFEKRVWASLRIGVNGFGRSVVHEMGHLCNPSDTFIVVAGEPTGVKSEQPTWGNFPGNNKSYLGDTFPLDQDLSGWLK